MSHPKLAQTDHDVLDVIRTRWSPRAFDPARAISRDEQHQLFEAARWTPSSNNEQPWEFLVADRAANPTAFEALLATLTSSNQTWAKHAPLLVLAAARPESKYGPNRFSWYDTGQAVMALTMQATSMGLASRQMAGFDSDKARQVCGVEPPFEPVVVIAIGHAGEAEALANERHRASETAPRARRPISDFVKWMGVIVMAMATIGFAPSVRAEKATVPAAPAYTYKVIHTYPHDKTSFTQGLVYQDGVLYESGGLNGKSNVRKVELATGKVLQTTPVDAQYFAEGLASWQGNLLQLTWQHGLGFVYDRATLQFKQTFRYSGEGWGLTSDDKRLILSDGNARNGLRFLDPVTFAETGRVIVKDQGAPVSQLNELEYVNGEVFANIWQTDRIARINPATGDVVGWIDLSGLLTPSERKSADVLNGIAHDKATGRLFVTGKLWPKLFEIQLAAKK